MDTIWNITDLIVLGAGFYALYAAYVLRTQGKIIKTFLVFKDTDVSSCKDLQGYANLMSPKLMVLGGVMVAYGAVSLFNTYVASIKELYVAFIILFLAVLFWYGYEVSRAMKKYF